MENNDWKPDFIKDDKVVINHLGIYGRVFWENFGENTVMVMLPNGNFCTLAKQQLTPLTRFKKQDYEKS